MADPAMMHGVVRHFRRTERRRLFHLLGDRELLARFVNDRDEAAFEEVVTRHGPMVRAVCRRILGPTADADDAFQAAFLVLVRRAKSIRKADLLAGWLCAVAYRTARQALRRRSRRGVVERSIAEVPEPARPDDPPKDWLPLFDDALQRLPAKYRDPVVLCELQGLSRRDASQRLGLTEGTLSSRPGRARDLLRRKLDRHGFPLAVGAALTPAVVPEALTASTAAAVLHISAVSVSAVVLMEGVITAMLVSKVKVGALAGTALLALGVAVGLPLTGPARGAGGPLTNQGPAPREVAAEPAKAAPAARPVAEPPPPPVAADADLTKVIGTWELIDVDGQSPDALAKKLDARPPPMGGPRSKRRWESLRRLSLLPAGGPMDLGNQVGTASYVAYVELDATRNPKWVTLLATETSRPADRGPDVRLSRAVRLCGIYKLDGDNLVVCLPEEQYSPLLRPAEFKGDGGGGLYLLTFHRITKDWKPAGPVSPPPVPAAPSASTPFVAPAGDAAPPAAGQPVPPSPALPAPELETPVPSPVPPTISPATAPQPPPPATAPATAELPAPTSDLARLQGEWVSGGWERSETLKFVGDRIVSDTDRVRFRLDETRSPRQITIEDGKPGETRTGIYKIEGDRLTIAICNASRKAVPINFEPDKDAGIEVSVYERVPAPPARDLAKEVEELRNQVDRLERLLRDRE